MKTIVAIKKFNSKSGRPVCIVTCCEERSEYELNNCECYGPAYNNYFVQGNDYSKFNNDSIGKKLVGFFGFSNGTNFVQNADIIK